MSIAYLPGYDSHCRSPDWPSTLDFRVLMRTVSADEAFPSYWGVANDYATYTAVLAANASYAALAVRESSAWDLDFDITPVVQGVGIRRGRRSLFDTTEAGVMQISILDPTGLFDPRQTTGVFGPGRRIRTGQRFRVEVRLGEGEWLGLMTGQVEQWGRDVEPGSDTNAACTVSDAFELIATGGLPAVDPPVGAGELSGARAQRVIDAVAWHPRWGDVHVDPGVVAMQGYAGGRPALEELKLVAEAEDGIVYVDVDGNLRVRDQRFRNDRQIALRILGREVAYFVTAYSDVAVAWATYAELLAIVPTYADIPGWFISSHDDEETEAPAEVVCGSTLKIVDDELDVRNDITIGRNNAPEGEVPANRYSEDSRVRHGLKSWKRNLDHLDPAWSGGLADRLLLRWADGEPRVQEAAIDEFHNTTAVETVCALEWGDIVEVIDRIPASGEAWSEPMELVGLTHQLTPTRWTTIFDIDRARA